MHPPRTPPHPWQFFRAGGVDQVIIRTAALAGGMALMRDDAERLIAAGITSREEVLRVTRD